MHLKKPQAIFCGLVWTTAVPLCGWHAARKSEPRLYPYATEHLKSTPERIRTSDTSFRKAVLYPLSYGSEYCFLETVHPRHTLSPKNGIIK